MELAINIIVAATQEGGIGLRGGLPWSALPSDMNYFKKITTTASSGKLNACIMGRVTYLSIPAKWRPLANRLNIILSRDENLRRKHDIPDNVIICSSFENALSYVDTIDKIDKVFVIGGASVYSEAMQSRRCKTIYYTNILNDMEYDVRFGDIDPNVYELAVVGPIQEERDIRFQFLQYVRCSP
jgi:dihydrofolate reductase